MGKHLRCDFSVGIEEMLEDDVDGIIDGFSFAIVQISGVIFFNSCDDFLLRSASTERTFLKFQINYLCCVCVEGTMHCVVPVGITKRPGCKGQMNNVSDIKFYLSRERMSPRWPLSLPPR